MPKSNLCKPRVDPRETAVRELIGAGLERQDISQNTLAKKVKISTGSMSAYKNNPRKMTLGTLWDIMDTLKSDENEKMKIV